MNKKNIFIFVLIIIIILGLIIFTSIRKDSKFYLSEESYNKAKLLDISLNDLNEKIEKKESFGLLVYQPTCSASSNFCNTLNEFQQQNNLAFYQIPYSTIKDDKQFEFLKFYPSFIIYKNGKVIDFLEANKDEDIEKYTSAKAFQDWFSKYVILK